MVQLRPAEPQDLAALLAVHREAFAQPQSEEIVHLVRELLADATAFPLTSLVADDSGAIVGHVLLTAATIEPAGHGRSARLLAPLAVAPSHQGRGVGGDLIRAALNRAAGDGVDLIFVLGHPGYYPRFGFQPAGAVGLEAPYPIAPHNAPAWMVRELTPGAIGAVRGCVRCAAALNQPQHWCE